VGESDINFNYIHFDIMLVELFAVLADQIIRCIFSGRVGAMYENHYVKRHTAC
jgi:hypothetical protein